MRHEDHVGKLSIAKAQYKPKHFSIQHKLAVIVQKAPIRILLKCGEARQNLQKVFAERLEL